METKNCSSRTTHLLWDYSEHIGYGYVVPTICIIGIVSNFLSILILFQMPTRAKTYTFLRIIAIMDLLTMIFVLPIGFARCHNCNNKGTIGYLRKFFEIYVYLPLSNITTTSSVLTTLVMGIERYIFVRHPIIHKVHKNKSSWIIACTLGFSCLFNLPYFFKYRIGECNSKDFTVYSQSIYYDIFSWSKAVLTKILPVILLNCISLMLLSAIWKQWGWFIRHNQIHNIELKRVKQHNRLTILIIITFFVFMVGNLPIIFVMKGIGDNLFKEKENSPTFRQIRVILNILELSTFAVNFFIYFHYDKQFSRIFWQKLRVPFKESKQISFELASLQARSRSALRFPRSSNQEPRTNSNSILPLNVELLTVNRLSVTV